MSRLTSLGGAKILARSGGTGSGTTSFLDAKSSTFYDFALQTILGSISLIGGDHLHEAEASRLLGVRVLHDLAFLNLSIFLEEAGHFGLGEPGMNTGDEEVGTRVNGSVFILAAIVLLRATND